MCKYVHLSVMYMPLQTFSYQLCIYKELYQVHFCSSKENFHINRVGLIYCNELYSVMTCRCVLLNQTSAFADSGLVDLVTLGGLHKKVI